ncbi:MAG: glycoside hydrolase family 2 TIM barrel-domain containing protein [Desulfuromonadales bacterium]|nr:glycoside hydrolase family 2 TIM barrel-domain containing protein [Desulfuromonadales bacterium]
MPRTNKLRRSVCLIGFLLSFCLATAALAQSPHADRVMTYKDSNGWKLLVNGESHFIKGVVWGYTPIGENYAYNLWGKPDEYIKKVLDYDCKLMKAAGVNTIRSFFNTPPKWVEYIYREYGIMTIVNDLMGRYGVMADGVWYPETEMDYSSPRIRRTLKNNFLETVRKFKNTPGVLMFALGNESNYGLHWRSGEIEDLPDNEQYQEKAKYLYSLFNEIIVAAKEIDPDRPYSIVNGDIQYIDLIAEYCTDLDVLGINAYRGSSFINDQSNLWADVKEKLDLPVMFMEFGSEAYNMLTDQEDQAAQANMLLSQWQEIYAKSYGNGEEGNAVGGCVFEWRDEWWKYKSGDVEQLEEHNREGTWSNGAFPFDYVEGEDNVNEEWFGIMQLGYPNKDGVSEAYPRMAYYVLQDVWKIDPYAHDRADIAAVDMQALELEADIRSLKQDRTRRKAFYLDGGSLRTEFLVRGLDSEIEEDGKDALSFSNSEMLFLDFGFRPSSRLTGEFSLNLIGNVPQSELEIVYGHDRDQNSLEIYDFNAVLKQKGFNLTAFYHVPRYHWGYEGDFYGLLWEATDMDGIDIWGQKAPFGIDFEGKKALDGLKVVFGPEIYWGANPKILAKYNFGSDLFKFTLMHSEDLDEASETSGGAEATDKATRATTFSAEITKISGTKIELGVISSGSEKIGDEFDRLDGDDIVYEDIEFEDTLGARARVTVEGVDFGLIYVEGSYAGLVAEGGEHHSIGDFDTELPHSRYGNKVTAEAGVGIFKGDYTIFPRVFWRENLEEANPIIDPVTTGTELFPGLNPRNLGEDPFAVLDNREALSGEVFFTYDPTPATNFYHWDNDNLEDAPLAYNIGFNYTEFSTATDSEQFYYLEGDTNAAFGWGQEKEDVWKVVSRMVINTEAGTRIVNRLEAGFQQSTGLPGPTREYYSMEFDVDVRDRHNVSGYIKKNQWGPYDFLRQFNITYPWQFKLGYMYKLKRLLQKYTKDRLGRSAGIGIVGIYKTLDENSPVTQYGDGENDYIFEAGTYLSLEF